MLLSKIFNLVQKEKEEVIIEKVPMRVQIPTFSNFVDLAAKEMSASTAANYYTAVRSFHEFCEGKEVPLTAIKRDLVKRYEEWLRQKNVSPNTSSCYLRALRAIYNKAVKRYRMHNKNPFQEAFTGNQQTAKRSVSAEDICRLRDLSLPKGSFQKLTRDIFLFSFYAMGMPLVDVAHLRWSQIKGDTIYYYRRKTGKQVKVKLETCMWDIIKCTREEISSLPTSEEALPEEDYVFPILTRGSYSSFLSYYNRVLKQLAEQCGIGAALTSYVSRHSWATLAYGQNVDLPVISKALGHHDTKTTLIYINEIEDHRLVQANKKILKKILLPSANSKK